MDRTAVIDEATFRLGPPPHMDMGGRSLVWIAAYHRVLSVCHMQAGVPGQTNPHLPEFTLHVSDLLLETGIRRGSAAFDLAGPKVGSLSAYFNRPEERSGSWDIIRCRICVERHEAGVDLSVEGTLAPGDDLEPEWRQRDITQFYFHALVPTADLTALFLAARWSTPEKGLAYLTGATSLSDAF